MINLMRADLYRMIRSKAFYIGIALMLVIIGTSIYNVETGSIGMYTYSDIEDNESFWSQLNELYEEEGISDADLAKKMRNIIRNIEGYDFDRDMYAHNMNLYYVFICIAVFSIASDFSDSTVKNTLSTAISRRKYYVSKLIFNMLICVLLTIIHNYLFHYLNILVNGSKISSDIANVTKMTFMQLPVMLAFSVMLSGIAFITKKIAVFNTVSIPFIIILQNLIGLLPRFIDIPEKYFSYELQTMIIKLAHEPSIHYVKNAYIVCGLLIACFSAAGWLAFGKAEIK